MADMKQIPIIQTLWVGNELSTMEQLSISSFLKNGHPFHLYTYNDVIGVPKGVVIMDANQILPSKMIFKCKHGSYAAFADIFRYKLLYEKGNYWVDTDMICLQPLTDDVEYVFASERLEQPSVNHKTHITNCLIKAPSGSDIMKYCYEKSISKEFTKIEWGEIGPKLIQQAVNKFNMKSCVAETQEFCPIDYWNWNQLIDPSVNKSVLAGSSAVHLWNEMWRRNNIDKEAEFDKNSIYQGLKKKYLKIHSLKIPYSKMDDHLISIIIPCYNQAQYLKESVESVINQTYQNIEIIIVNDGSTDESGQVAIEMIKNNSTKRIRLINQVNKGLAEARNSGIRAALGEYIFTLDADDKLNKNILQKGMNAMIEHSVDVVYTDYRCFDEKNTIVNTISTVDLYFILYSNITGATALYKKSLWKKIGGYKPNMNGGYEDWEFWVNATKHGFKFYRIPLVLFYYRVKKESMYIDALKKHTYLYSKIVINHPEQYTNIQRNNAIKSINEFEDSADIYFYFNTQNCVNEKEIISLIINSINNNKLNNLFQSGENYIIPAQDKFYSIALYNLESNDKSMKQNVDHIVYYAKLKYDFTNDTFDKLKCSSLAWNAEKGIVQSQGTIFPFTFLNDLSFETEANKRFDEFTNYGSLIRAIRQKKSDISNLELEIKNLMIQEKLLLQELR